MQRNILTDIMVRGTGTTVLSLQMIILNLCKAGLLQKDFRSPKGFVGLTEKGVSRANVILAFGSQDYDATVGKKDIENALPYKEATIPEAKKDQITQEQLIGQLCKKVVEILDLVGNLYLAK